MNRKHDPRPAANGSRCPVQARRLLLAIVMALFFLSGATHAQTGGADESANQALQAMKDKQAEFRKLKYSLRKIDVNKDDERIDVLVRLKDISAQIEALRIRYEAVKRASQLRSRLDSFQSHRRRRQRLRR